MHLERLRGGIDVMEVQIDRAAVVAADGAAAPRLLDERGPDPAVPAGHCLPYAALAAIDEPVAPAIAVEDDEPVARAFAEHGGALRIRRASGTFDKRPISHERMFASAPDGECAPWGS